MCRSFLGDFHGQQQPGLSACQGNQARRACFTGNSISLPMPQFGAVIGCLGSLFNRVTDTKLTSRFFFALFAARFAAVTELACNTAFAVRQSANLKASGIDGSIDCGMAHPIGTIFQFCSVCYLLRRPLLIQYLLPHKGFDFRLVEYSFPAAFLSPLPILVVRLSRPVSVLPTVPFQFSADCSGTSSKCPTDFSDAFRL